MDNQSTSYNYQSLYNLVPATAGAALAYIGSKVAGVESMEEVLVGAGMIGGVSINGFLWERLRGVQEKVSKLL